MKTLVQTLLLLLALSLANARVVSNRKPTTYMCVCLNASVCACLQAVK